MTAAEILAGLKSIGDEDWDQLEVLAQRILADARAGPSVVARFLDASQPDFRAKASFVLGHLEELSVLPWVDASHHFQGDIRMLALAKAASAYSAFAEKCVALLKRGLHKREVLPAPPLTGEVEERPARERECDAAYVLLRRWMYPGETNLKYEQNRSLYLKLSDAERDREIAEYERTGHWQDFR